jgi:hypothetical protein
MKEKIIYEAAMMKLAAEAQEAGIKGVTYEDFRRRREEAEQRNVEQLETLRKELDAVQGKHS